MTYCTSKKKKTSIIKPQKNLNFTVTKALETLFMNKIIDRNEKNLQ